MTKVFGIVGWKNSGKTTLMERLIAHFDEMGLYVGAIKRAHHTVQLDQPGTDSFRYRESGARQVALVSQSRVGFFEERRDLGEPELPRIIAQFADADLILIEGFKTSPHPKIEARRAINKNKGPLGSASKKIVAIASDFDEEETGILPHFALDDVNAIARFILNY